MILYGIIISIGDRFSSVYQKSLRTPHSEFRIPMVSFWTEQKQ